MSDPLETAPALAPTPTCTATLPLLYKILALSSGSTACEKGHELPCSLTARANLQVGPWDAANHNWNICGAVAE